MSDMVNINKNSYFTLKVNDNAYAYIESLDDFSLCGGNPFTLLFVFYPLQTQMDICLMKQEGAFATGYKNDSFYYNAKGMESILIQGINPIKNVWNSIAITYDGSIIKVYYQGIKAYEKEVITEFCTNSNESIIGEQFSGYIKKVCCFDHALSRNSLNAVLYSQDSEESKKTAMFYLDFEGENAVDYGRYNKPIQIKNEARQVNIVKALQINDNGYLQNIEAMEGQYRGLFRDAYTILTKVYLNPTFKENAILFNNGGYGDEIGLTIGIKNETTGAKPFLDCMDERILAEKNISYDKWVDIAVTVEDTNVVFYEDGKEIGKGVVNKLSAYLPSYKMTLGNGLQNGVPVKGMYFDGCMDYFSVFNSALDSEKLKSYVEVSPFIYNNDIAIFYSFADNSPIEKISNTTYTLSNASVEIQEGTECCANFENICYFDETTDHGLTEYEFWEANFMAILLTSYIEAQTGIKPTSGFSSEGVLSNGAAQMLHTKVVPLESSKNSIGSLYDVSEEDIINVEAEIRYRGLDSIINETFFGGAGVDIIAGASTASGMAAAAGTNGIPSAGIAAGVLGAALAATIIVAAIIKIPPPIVEGKIVLKSVAFHWKNQDEGYDYSKKAIPLSVIEESKDSRGYKKKQIDVPEWQLEKDGATFNVISQPICYIQEKISKPIIRAEFEYKAGNQKEFIGFISASISVKEQNYTGKKDKRVALGNIPAKQVVFNNDGVYVVDFELDHCRLKEEELGYVQCVWLWKIEEKNLLVGTSSHDVYTIGKEPLKPWEYAGNDPCKIVSQEFLKLWGDLTKRSGGLTAATAEVLGKRLTPAFFKCERFRYNKISEVEKTLGAFSTVKYYSGIPIFYKDEFEYNYCKDTNQNINITSLDASCIMDALLKMNGVNVTLLSITSNCDVFKSEYTDEEKTTISYAMIPIQFKDIIHIGRTQKEPASEAIHYVLGDMVVEEPESIDVANNYNKSLIIDVTVSIQDTTGKSRYAAYLPFSDDVGDIAGEIKEAEEIGYYRELFGQAYSGFQINRVFNAVTFAADEKEDKMSLLKYQQLEAKSIDVVYNGTDGFIYRGTRPGFCDAVLNYITVKECETERCHYFSYATIRDIVLGIYNSCIEKQEIKADQVEEQLKLLYKEVLCYAFDSKIKSITDKKKKESIMRLHKSTLENLEIENILGKQTQCSNNKTLIQLIYKNIRLLNSSFYNLREGQQSWNHLIRECYDCRSWSIISYENSKCLYDSSGNIYADLEKNVLICITDIEEVDKLGTMKQIVETMGLKITDYISFLGQSIHLKTTSKEYVVVCSSNNDGGVWGTAKTNNTKIHLSLEDVYYEVDGMFGPLFS